MTTQPLENGEMIPVQTQPIMPTAGKQRTTVRKEPSSKTSPLHTENARISRRNSLRKQRESQKATKLLLK